MTEANKQQKQWRCFASDINGVSKCRMLIVVGWQERSRHCWTWPFGHGLNVSKLWCILIIGSHSLMSGFHDSVCGRTQWLDCRPSSSVASMLIPMPSIFAALLTKTHTMAMALSEFVPFWYVMRSAHTGVQNIFCYLTMLTGHLFTLHTQPTAVVFYRSVYFIY